jgi:hypothetical protein
LFYDGFKSFVGVFGYTAGIDDIDICLIVKIHAIKPFPRKTTGNGGSLTEIQFTTQGIKCDIFGFGGHSCTLANDSQKYELILIIIAIVKSRMTEVGSY